MKIFSAIFPYSGKLVIESANVVRETNNFYFLDRHINMSLRVDKSKPCAFSRIEALQHLYKKLTDDLSVLCEQKILKEKSIADVRRRMETEQKICDIKTIEGCL